MIGNYHGLDVIKAQTQGNTGSILSYFLVNSSVLNWLSDYTVWENTWTVRQGQDGIKALGKKKAYKKREDRH